MRRSGSCLTCLDNLPSFLPPPLALLATFVLFLSRKTLQVYYSASPGYCHSSIYQDSLQRERALSSNCYVTNCLFFLSCHFSAEFISQSVSLSLDSLWWWWSTTRQPVNPIRLGNVQFYLKLTDGYLSHTRMTPSMIAVLSRRFLFRSGLRFANDITPTVLMIMNCLESRNDTWCILYYPLHHLLPSSCCNASLARIEQGRSSSLFVHSGSKEWRSSDPVRQPRTPWYGPQETQASHWSAVYRSIPCQWRGLRECCRR